MQGGRQIDSLKGASGAGQSLSLSSSPPCVEEILQAAQITSLTSELDLSYARGLTERSLGVLLRCLPNLRTLSLRHTGLHRLPNVLHYVPELRGLDVSNNSLGALPASLGTLAKLQHLSATHNRIDALPASLGRLHLLRFLDVSHNRLVALGPEIRFCKALRVLRLASNQLSELNEGVGELSQLQLLHLAFNRLSRLPAELKNAAQLRVLNVGFNALRELPDELATLTQLAHVDLTSNDITGMPRCLLHMQTVRVHGLKGFAQHGANEQTQVTLPVSHRHGMLQADEATQSTRRIDIGPIRAARAIITGVRHVFDGVTGAVGDDAATAAKAEQDSMIKNTPQMPTATVHKRS